MDSENSSAQAVPRAPSAGTKSAVSLLLLIHFSLALGAFYASQAPAGVDMPTLKDRFLARCRIYSQLLNFESFAPLSLTHGTVDDVDHRIEYATADSHGQWKNFSAGSTGSDRKARYQRLATLLAYFAVGENENNTAEVETAVARRLIVAEEEKVSVIRSRRHFYNLQRPADFRDRLTPTINVDDPNFVREMHRAQVLNFGNGDIRMQKVEEKGLVAPPTQRSDARKGRS